ncbi:hypothetical protein ILYODFUR_033409 [Ilyodon furcidens]|uniref:Uncharacterized protein n=1 Tax=Ilyodon furcidens TaxID=33524 RepID=A0ABV0VA24_9TELE
MPRLLMSSRGQSGLEDVFNFVERFPELLPFQGPKENDRLSEEFLEYQLMDISTLQDSTTLTWKLSGETFHP